MFASPARVLIVLALVGCASLAVAPLAVAATPTPYSKLAVSMPEASSALCKMTDWGACTSWAEQARQRRSIAIKAAKAMGATHVRVWAYWDALAGCNADGSPNMGFPRAQFNLGQLKLEIQEIRNAGMTPFVSISSRTDQKSEDCPRPFSVNPYYRYYGNFVAELVPHLVEAAGASPSRQLWVSFWNEPDHYNASFLCAVSSARLKRWPSVAATWGGSNVAQRIKFCRSNGSGTTMTMTINAFRALHREAYRRVMALPAGASINVLCCETTSDGAVWLKKALGNRTGPASTLKFDGFALHTYQHYKAPGQSCPALTQQAAYRNFLGLDCLTKDRFEKVLKKHRFKAGTTTWKPIWVTEFGYLRPPNDVPAKTHNDTERAAWGNRALRKMASNRYLDMQTWYDVLAPPPDPANPSTCQVHAWEGWFINCFGTANQMFAGLWTGSRIAGYNPPQPYIGQYAPDPPPA